MRTIDVTERAKLWRAVLLLVMPAATWSCIYTETSTSGPLPTYDARTRQLLRLDWDADGNGRLDHRTYFVNATAVRTEVDSDDDGRVDRWEYVDRFAQPTHVGTSSAGDGVEDTWTWPADASGEVRVDLSQHRDRVVDRREFSLEDSLVRAEEDANRDGVIDKWETWERGALRVAAFDSRFTTGRPDRRLIYDAGRFVFMEADIDGDGHFERLERNQPGIRRADQ